MKNKGICFVCGREVPANNNALLLEIEAEKITRYGFDYKEEQVEKWIYALAYVRQCRHLFPVTENGETVCSGSPKHLRYVLKRQSNSSEDEEKLERLYQAAYERMLALAAKDEESAPHA